jgi:hypothetical protein
MAPTSPNPATWTGRRGDGDQAAPAAIRRLALAAAPTFGAMALWTAMADGTQEVICAGGRSGFPLGPMTVMYVLMSLFHAGPWITLLFGRRPRA